MNKLLQPRPAVLEAPVVDLFAGCGGLALGLEAAGLPTIGFEMSASAAATYRGNLQGDCFESKLHVGTALPSSAVVVGGPPCQPFSNGGQRRADQDERNGIPAFLDAVRRLQPELALLENVVGLTVGSRKPYFKGILDELEAMQYEVDHAFLWADRWDVPQRRRRVFVVAHHGGFEWPAEQTKDRAPTVAQAIGDLLDAPNPAARWLTPSMDAYIARYEAASGCRVPRDLDMTTTSRTLTCRNLGGATGDMIRLVMPDGRRRRIEVREAARLQSFPDWYGFEGSQRSQFEQIGNAVPPLLARALGLQIVDYLIKRGVASGSVPDASTIE